jgi:peptidyl-prolyl cis-trans isomerase SurA
MRRARIIACFCLYLAAWPVPGAAAGQGGRAPGGVVVDRIVARIEDDIITLSQMEELAAFQDLVEGHAKSDKALMDELIEQWIVNNEATAAQFPQPAKSEVDREVGQIRKRFATPQAYAQRLAELGLSPESVRRVVTRQIYLERYLDYKFRPAVQVSEQAITDYYHQHLVPALQARGENAPPLDTVTDRIRELLVEKGISDRSTSWIEETKSRLKIEIEPQMQAALDGKS